MSEFPPEISVISPRKFKEVSAEFEPLVSKALKDAGFSIIDPKKTEGVLATFLKETGGSEKMIKVDAIGLKGLETGERAGSNQRPLIQKLLHRIKTKFSVDALLIPAIEFREAETYSVWGHWDGAWQALDDSALVANKPAGAYLSGDGVLLPGILSPAANNVRLPALSLSSYLISVEDGQTVWWGFGGISLLETFDGPVTPIKALQDSKRNAEAVKIVFRSLNASGAKKP